MNIGIDAGALSITDNRLKVGVYKVTLRLIERISIIGYSNYYRLYSFKPIGEDISRSFGSNVKNVVLSPSFGFEKIRLPIELLFHPVDVFLGLSQSIPVSSSYNIGFIYDIGFIHRPEDYINSSNKLFHQTNNLVKKASCIIVISNAVKNDIINYYNYPSSKIFVIYPGVDRIFNPIGNIFNNKKPYFLFVGALKPGKNIPEILLSFSLFLKKYGKPYDLILVGGDLWKDNKIDKLISSLHLNECVKQVGHVSDEELASLYRGATSLQIASYWEGFCLPAAEAMASGCPVIASDNGAIREVLNNSGLIIENGNRQDRVEAMMMTIKNRYKFSKYGLIQSKKFNWQKFTDEVQKIIDNPI